MITTGVLADIVMKIWRNDKRVVKASQYIDCKDCALCGDESTYCFECLALLYGINNPINVCFKGYKYETDV
jgi:hypothetical protein